MKQLNHRGFVLVVIVIALVLLGIIVPLLVTLIQKESKDSAAQSKKTIAFQLAEAGQDRGAWKLRESDMVWTNALAGTPLTNYNDDTVFTDVAGGTYKIKITSSSTSGQVIVVSKGLATNNNELRAIQAEYAKGAVAGALSVVGGLDWKSNLVVEWGPVVSYSSISSAPPTRYPRKYSAGSIAGAGYDATDPNPPNGAMPSGNWAAYDYASYYSLGTAPTVKLNDYRTIAKNSCVPPLDAVTGSGAAAHDLGPSGCDSGYYTANVNIDKATGSGDYTFTCSTCVIFVEGEVKSFPNKAWLNIKALLATGDVDFNAKDTTFIATVPVNAQDEYQYNPAGINHWTAMGWTNGGTYSIANCGMHGFLYSGGDIKNGGGNTILVGSLYVLGTLTVNTTTVYYDANVADNILFETANITRQSWDEIRTSW